MVLIGTLLVLVVCGVIAAQSSKKSDQNTLVQSSTTSTSAANTAHFKLGDTSNVGSYWQATINSFKAVPGSDFDQPKSGNRFIAVDITVKNTSTASHILSGLVSFSLKDSTGQKYTETFVTGLPAAPDGTVEAGGVVRGTIAYEVPNTQKTFAFSFQPDFADTNQSIWDLTLS